MSDYLDEDDINDYLDFPMTSEPDRLDNVVGDESELDDTDDDPDFRPSDNSHSDDDELSSNAYSDEMDVDIAHNDSVEAHPSAENGTNPTVTTGQWGMFEGKQKHFTCNSVSDFSFNLPVDAKPLDVYSEFLNDEILNMMVVETNRNAQNVISKVRLNRSSRLKKWTPTNCDEMKKFIGLLLWMGLASYPRITDYWSKNILYKNHVASKVMSRNRFQLMLRFWHFNNDDNIATEGRIVKISPLINKLNALFLSHKTADQVVVIDESMVPFRGRLKFRQYLPNKAHKYGIKIFKLCDVTGYTFNLKLYMGKGTQTDPTVLMTTSIVTELMANHLDKGHVLFVDNYYSSLELAHKLIEKSTHLVGTIRSNRKGLPEELKQRLKKGEMVSMEDDDGIVVSKWKDKRDVRMISTKHGIDFIDTGKTDRKGNPILKPSVVMDYNKAKVGIDISDQMSSYNTGVRKSMRWYHKLAEELILGTAVVNSFLAYTHYVKGRPSASGQQKKYCMSTTTFKEKLAFSLMGLEDQVLLPPVKQTGHHHLAETEFSGEGRLRRRMRKNCKMCYKKAMEEGGRKKAKSVKKITTYCEKCPGQPYLCRDCFKVQHK